MKFVKFALTPPIVAISVALCASLSSFGDVVYVKPVACGSGDGSSWANAMGSVSNALMQALKTPAPHEVRMAKGVYKWLSAIAVGPNVKGEFDPEVSGAYPFSICGGYAGVSEDELPDIAANPTWLSFDVNGDDRWVKYNLSTYAYTGSSTAVDCGKMVDDDGKVVLPDDTDDPDALYCIDANKAGDNAAFLNLLNNGTANFVELSNLCFVGGGMNNRYASGDSSFISATTASVVMKNCTFLGGYFTSSSGVWNMTYPTQAVIVDDVKFLWSTVGRCLFSVGNGALSGDLVKGLQVKGIRATGNSQGGVVFWCNPMTSATFLDCQFEKVYASCSHGGYVAPAGVFGFENASGCLISNCVFRQVCTRGTDTAAVIDIRRRDSSKTMREMRVIDCLFEKNISYTTGETVNNLGIVMLAGNGASLEGCTFKDNEIVVKPTGACKTAYAATVTVGASRDFPEADAPRRMLVNCTFSGNDVKADSGSNSEAVTPRCFSRGVLLNSAYENTPIDLVVADCTFVDGDSALPHVRWTGVDKTYPISVVNSYFHGDAANGYVPFVTAELGMIEADNCLMNGSDVLPAGVVGDGNVFMELPVGGWDDLNGTRIAPVRRIGADVTALRSGLPLKEFVAQNVTYLTDSEGDHIYRSATIAVPETTSALTDAVGDARPVDAVTIGAVQALTAKAENGATLYVDIRPKSAGSLSGGGTVQVVDKSEGIVEITATSSDPSRYTFEGWKRPDGSVYSDAATLTISKLDDNLQLTASFSAPKVTYTFDLGAAGTFDDSGESKVVLELDPGDKLTVPAFTIDETKVVPYGWDVTPPATVGTENATFTYQYLEKIYRIIRVDTAAADGGDGSTWANAMNDIQAAIDLAGAWQGEVWIRQGVHRIGKTAASYLTMKKNVQILGGFEGVDGQYDDVETERAARDPEAFRSVLTGDINLDDIWRSTETGVEADMRDATNGVFTVVGADGKFRMPEFKSGRICYGHRSPTTNIGVIFDNTEASIDETAVLDGVTLTGAAKGVDNGKGARPVVRNCTFMGAVKYLSKTWITCQNCQFIAVGMGQVAVDDTTVMRFYEGDANGGHTILDGCMFKYCYGAGRGIVAFQAGTQYYFEAKDCLFEQCTGSSSLTKYYGTTFGCEQCTGLITGVTIHNCWNTTGAALALFPQAGSVVVTNCLFEGNSVVQNKDGTWTSSTGDIPSAIVTTASDGGPIRLYNCTFRSNEVDRTVSNHANSKNAQAAVVYLKGKDGSSLVNCTFDGNVITCSSPKGDYPAKASTVLVRQIGTTVAKAGVANCTFVNNAAADGDIYLADRTGTTPFYLVNTICWGGEGHQAVTASGAGNAELYAWNSIVHGLNAGASFVADVTDCATTSPGAMRKWTESELMPHFAKAVGGSSAAAKGGRNVYADAKNVICVPTSAAETAFINLATGAAVTPSGAKALLPDVFGNARTAGEVTMGAFEGRYGDGMAILVR